jgi:hypothetical protein
MKTGASGSAQVVELLPTKHKALNSTPSTKNKQIGKTLMRLKTLHVVFYSFILAHVFHCFV